MKILIRNSRSQIWTLNSSFHFVKLGKIQLLDRRLESHNIIYLVFIKRVHTPPPIHTNTHTIRQLLCSSQVYRQPPVAYTYTCVQVVRIVDRLFRDQPKNPAKLFFHLFSSESQTCFFTICLIFISSGNLKQHLNYKLTLFFFFFANHGQRNSCSKKYSKLLSQLVDNLLPK